ncbi:glycoside hydrolase family protein [Escherichia coli]|nr:glycoside hydrolase family protein [Escherichia coli]
MPLTEPQKAGIASFCPYNIGPGKCFPSTFYRRINAGDRKRCLRSDSLVD